MVGSSSGDRGKYRSKSPGRPHPGLEAWFLHGGLSWISTFVLTQTNCSQPGHACEACDPSSEKLRFRFTVQMELVCCRGPPEQKTKIASGFQNEIGSQVGPEA